MHILGLIVKKRDGQALSKKEIDFIVEGYTGGTIPDFQIAALLMAIYYQGMDENEISFMTEAMLNSGETISLPPLSSGKYVDKHSTGGVGDKVSLILAPLVAACGLKVPMMSGRSLGHTGGTLDKLESIEHYNVAIPPDKFREIIAEGGFAMVGQTEHIVPADKKLYALRDITGTVPVIPLIVSSILSKKIAEGSQAIVLDVKCGRGAFMKTNEQARNLAHMLQNTSRKLGVPLIAVLTRMDDPLGYAVGNFLEIEESAACLGGYHPEEKYPRALSDDLMETTKRLAVHMLLVGEIAATEEQASAMIEEKLTTGDAWNYFLRNVKLQGGDPERLKGQFGVRRAPFSTEIYARETGYIASIDALKIGNAGIELGVGRRNKEDRIDMEAGLLFRRMRGDRVEKGDTICEVYASHEKKMEAALPHINDAIDYSTAAPALNTQIIEEYTHT